MENSLPKSLLVLDFDGFLVDPKEAIVDTCSEYGISIDWGAFRHQESKLRYFGEDGLKSVITEIKKLRKLFNLFGKRKNMRQTLTKKYQEKVRLRAEMRELLEEVLKTGETKLCILSKNTAENPSELIRSILKKSGIAEKDIDQIDIHTIGHHKKKSKVLPGILKDAEEKWGIRKESVLSTGDEVSDWKAGANKKVQIPEDNILIGSFGFDSKEKLIHKGVPETQVFETPADIVKAIREKLH